MEVACQELGSLTTKSIHTRAGIRINQSGNQPETGQMATANCECDPMSQKLQQASNEWPLLEGLWETFLTETPLTCS